MENIKVYIKNRNKSEKYIWNIYNKKYNSQKRIINNINKWHITQKHICTHTNIYRNKCEIIFSIVLVKIFILIIIKVKCGKN